MAADSSEPRLPPELIAHIVDLSARSEPAPSPHHLALALTSRAVHAFSEAGRWASIALRTRTHFLAFADFLGADQLILRRQARLADVRVSWRAPDLRARRWCPDPKTLCSYITNFLAEVEPLHEMTPAGAPQGVERHKLYGLSYEEELWTGILHRLTYWSPALRVMSLNATALHRFADVKRQDHRKQRALHTLFPQGPPVVHTAPPWPHPAAVGQYDLLSDPVIGPYGPEELTIEWHGNEWTLRAVLFPDCWCEPPSPDALAANDRTNIPIARPPVFVGLSSRLRRLHIIGLDPVNQYDGHVIPVELLMESVIAGSLPAINYLVRAREVTSKIWRGMIRKKALMERYLAQHPNQPMSSDAYLSLPPGEVLYETYEIPDRPIAIPVVTHLRYDTVRFTFRPFESLAARMRPLFEHLHVVGAPYPPKPAPELPAIRAGRPRARHPRHDAAVLSTLSNDSYHIPVDQDAISAPSGRPASDALTAIEAADYHLRTAFGAGAFARLHLAWDPPPLPEVDPISQLPTGVAAAVTTAAPPADNSGWPTERRDVWTNHSSPAAGPAASTTRRGTSNATASTSRSGAGPSRPGPSNAATPFTMELAEAIEHRIQYPYTQQLFEARARSTYPARALVPARTDEQLQTLRAHDPLWLSDAERWSTYLSRILGQELVLRECAPAQLAAAAAAGRSAVSGFVGGSGSAGRRRALNEEEAAALPEGTLVDREFLIEPAFLPELEVVPVSPYAPTPDGPAPASVSSSSLLATTDGGPLSQFRRPLLPHPVRAGGGPSSAAAAARPEPILKLAGAWAAFTPEERVRLFVERIRGQAGAWV